MQRFLLALLALLFLWIPFAEAGFIRGDTPDFHPGFRASQYYSHPLENSASTMAVAANTHYATPLFVPVTTTFTKLGFEVTVAATTGARCIQAIYDTGSAIPSARQLIGTEQAADSTGIKESTVSLTLNPGWYWLTLNCNNTPTVRASVLTTRVGLFGATSTTANNTAAYYRTETYSTTPPATFGAVTENTTTTIPKVWVRL